MTRGSAVLVILVAVLATAADVLGGLALIDYIWPGPSGEWAVASLLFSYVINLPIGLIGIASSRLAASAPPRLRRICLWVSAISVAIPLAGWLIRHLRGW